MVSWGVRFLLWNKFCWCDGVLRLKYAYCYCEQMLLVQLVNRCCWCDLWIDVMLMVQQCSEAEVHFSYTTPCFTDAETHALVRLTWPSSLVTMVTMVTMGGDHCLWMIWSYIAVPRRSDLLLISVPRGPLLFIGQVVGSAKTVYAIQHCWAEQPLRLKWCCLIYRSTQLRIKAVLRVSCVAGVGTS